LDRCLRRTAKDETLAIETFPFTHGGIIPHHDARRLYHFVQRAKNTVTVPFHAGRQNLEAYGISIAVHDQARQPVRFAMDETVWIRTRVRRPGLEHSLTPGPRPPEALNEEGAIYRHWGTVQQADQDRAAGIQIAAPEELSAGVEDIHEIAGFRMRRRSLNLVFVDPRMPGE